MTLHFDDLNRESPGLSSIFFVCKKLAKKKSDTILKNLSSELGPASPTEIHQQFGWKTPKGIVKYSFNSGFEFRILFLSPVKHRSLESMRESPMWRTFQGQPK